MRAIGAQVSTAHRIAQQLCPLMYLHVLNAFTAAMSSNVRPCKFSSAACPGVKNQSRCDGAKNNDDDEFATNYCACGYTGPFCAECDTNYFLVSISQAQSECKSCNEGRSWLPTIVSGVLVVSCSLLIVGACFKTGLSKRILSYYKVGKVKGMTILQACQVIRQ